MATNAKLVNLLQQIISLPDLQEIIAMTLHEQQPPQHGSPRAMISLKGYCNNCMALYYDRSSLVLLHLWPSHKHMPNTTFYVSMYVLQMHPTLGEKAVISDLFSPYIFYQMLFLFFSVLSSVPEVLVYCCLWGVALLKLKIIQTNGVLTQIPSN